MTANAGSSSPGLGPGMSRHQRRALYHGGSDPEVPSNQPQCTTAADTNAEMNHSNLLVTNTAAAA
jgi:hypothetical protein